MLGRLLFKPGAEAPAAPAPGHELAELGMQIQQRQLEITYKQALYSGQQLLETLLAAPALADPKRLERHGWKVYSQNDEDGILAEIFRRIGAPQRSFVEFGCGDGMENNSLYLLSQGWRGLWIDGSENNAAAIGRAYAPLLASRLLQFSHSFVTRDNIDALIAAADLGPEIDLLSIDLDGNDYHVWEAISAARARVVVVEYNAKFRPPNDWCMAYDAGHEWIKTDFMGASLEALTRLGEARGYQLVGCTIIGANAFFVRRDLAADKFAAPASAAHLFQPPRYELGFCFRLQTGHPIDPRTVVHGATAAQQPKP
ncbi:MAG: hypothetical protein JWN73_5107 [Betaproteobacteria bacterium]|nr:hypothetical protein [Betaproteobacteria bacterium]